LKGFKLWKPTPEYLELIKKQHPRKTEEEMRQLGWLRKKRGG
jgi:hypothetical protein